MRSQSASERPTGVLDRLTAPGPKRILALDGGGVRGAITIGFLERIELVLRERHDRRDLRLYEYFDLIGGTSVGSILAAGLATGMEVAELRETYLRLTSRIFGQRRWKLWNSLFVEQPLKELLTNVFGDRTIDDPAVLTGLCVVAKRADTRSTWPVSNHPHGRYFSHNRAIKLRDLVYASAAAPFFFVPTAVEVGRGEVGAFVDGGVSMSNNPALQLFLMATLHGYPFHWQTGEDQLLLTSVGTGVWEGRESVERVLRSRAWDWTREVPKMLIEDASTWNQLLLQLVSRSPTACVIDDEVGNLEQDLLVPEPLLSYLRYNARMTPAELKDVGLPSAVPRIESLQRMSSARNRYELLRVGRRFASKQVQPEHFPHVFDLASAPTESDPTGVNPR